MMANPKWYPYISPYPTRHTIIAGWYESKTGKRIRGELSEAVRRIWIEKWKEDITVEASWLPEPIYKGHDRCKALKIARDIIKKLTEGTRYEA